MVRKKKVKPVEEECEPCAEKRADERSSKQLEELAAMVDAEAEPIADEKKKELPKSLDDLVKQEFFKGVIPVWRCNAGCDHMMNSKDDMILHALTKHFTPEEANQIVSTVKL